jgi:hypothetical protein
MLGFSLCAECGRRLRDAIFCPYCGASACCWTCYEEHHALKHATTAAPHEFPCVRDAASAALVAGRNDLEHASPH